MSATQINGTNLQIPVIDLSHPTAQTADKLIEAVSRYGFVFVRGEGLGFTPQKLNDTFEMSKAFFNSPIEEKRKCAIRVDNIGWSSMHSETLDPEHQKRGDFKEAINIAEFKNGKAQQTLTPSLALHEADLHHFYIDPSKGGEDFFASRHDPSKGSAGSILRLLHGESSFDNVKDIRAGAHSDYGSLTLLFQRAGQPGLEVLSPSSSWSPVPVYPPSTESDTFPPILVNIGDLTQFWTAGILKSTIHRVVFPEGGSEDRYSIAYFCHPLNKVEIETVPSEMVSARSKRKKQENGETITAGGYLKKRLAETYGWGKEESPARD